MSKFDPKQTPQFSRGKFGRFMTTKGFYTAVALCLAGAGAATWLAVDRTIGGIERAGRQNFASIPIPPIVEEVEKKQPDVPKVTQPPTPPVTQAAIPAPPAAQAPPAEVSAEAPVTVQEDDMAAATEAVDAPAQIQTLTFTLPISGDIVKPFSHGELVKNTTLNDWRTHDGVDIVAPEGSEVFAAADGVVKEVRNDPLWGTVLIISHFDGKESLYAGLTEAMPVRAGETVVARQAVGKLIGVPCEMGEDVHLHFAVKQDGNWIDPLSILN